MAEAGWYPDPYGRFPIRWFDGQQWTAHVQVDGSAKIDPMGAGYDPKPADIQLQSEVSEVQQEQQDEPHLGARQDPPATEATGRARFAEASAKVEERAQAWTQALTPFLESLGPVARQRPEPSLIHSIAAGGGAVGFVGLWLLLVGEGAWDDSPSLGTLAVVSGLVIVGAWFVMTRIPDHLDFLRYPAVAASLLAIPTLSGALTVDTASTASGQTIPTAALGISAAAYLVGWSVIGFKGRPTFLASGLIFAVLTLSSALADRSQFRGGSFDRWGNRNPVLSFVEDLEYQLGLQATFLVIASILLLLIALQLDRSGFFGVATGFVLSGLLTAGAVAAIAYFTTTPVLVGILLFVATVLACSIGVAGQRRATTWIGAAGLVVWIPGVFGAVFRPDSLTSVGFVVLIGAAALIVAPTYALKTINKSKESKQG